MIKQLRTVGYWILMRSHGQRYVIDNIPYCNSPYIKKYNKSYTFTIDTLEYVVISIVWTYCLFKLETIKYLHFLSG